MVIHIACGPVKVCLTKSALCCDAGSFQAAGLSIVVQAGGVQLTAEELADARCRLAAGLKRYFHGKRTQGLLSSQVSAEAARSFHCAGRSWLQELHV